MADPMDLGPFMQNYVLNNPFQNIDGGDASRGGEGHKTTSAATCRHEKRAPPRRRRGGAGPPSLHAASAVSPSASPLPPLTVAQTASACDVTKEPREFSAKTEAPKGHIGSNARYASLLKTLQVPTKHEEPRAWLLAWYRHLPGYSGWINSDELLRHMQIFHPKITSPILSRIIKVTFPHCRKITNKNGYFYEGLIQRPQNADYDNAALMEAVEYMRDHQDASYAKAAVMFKVPEEALANMVLWNFDASDDINLAFNLLKGPRNVSKESLTRDGSESSSRMSATGSEGYDSGNEQLNLEDPRDEDFLPTQVNMVDSVAAAPARNTYNTRRKRIDVRALQGDSTPKRIRSDSDQSGDSSLLTPPPSGSARRKQAVTSRAPGYVANASCEMVDVVHIKQEPPEEAEDTPFELGQQLAEAEGNELLEAAGFKAEEQTVTSPRGAEPDLKQELGLYRRMVITREAQVGHLEGRLREAHHDLERMRETVGKRDKQLTELMAEFFELSNNFMRLSHHFKAVMADVDSGATPAAAADPIE